MTPDWTAVIALEVFAILLVTLWIGRQVAAIRRFQDPYAPAAPFDHGHYDLPAHTQHSGRSGHYVVWEWRGGAWQAAPAGEDSGPPPAYPGKFEGETLKLWVPRR